MLIPEREAATQAGGLEHEPDLLQARPPYNLPSRVANDRRGLMCLV